MRDKTRTHGILQNTGQRKRCKFSVTTAIPLILCWIIGAQVLFMLFGVSNYHMSSMRKQSDSVYAAQNGLDNASGLANTTTNIPPENDFKSEVLTYSFHIRKDPVEAVYYRRRTEKINLHNFTYLIDPGPCKIHERGIPYLLVFVFSIYHKQNVREAIRETWGSVGMTRFWPGEKIKHKVRLYFLLGNSPDSWRDKLKNESDTHRDLIQENFQESYSNLTIKSIMALKWTTESCPEASFILKSDDDMIIHIPAILDYLDGNKDLENTLVGALNGRSRVYRAGRWGVSRKSFPFTFYPPYMAGNAYLMPVKLATELYETSKYVPLIKIEDVYVTGILPYVLGKHVKHRKHKGFSDWLGKIPNHCDIMNRRKVTATKMNAETMRKIWRSMLVTQRTGSKCL